MRAAIKSTFAEGTCSRTANKQLSHQTSPHSPDLKVQCRIFKNIYLHKSGGTLLRPSYRYQKQRQVLYNPAAPCAACLAHARYSLVHDPSTPLVVPICSSNCNAENAPYDSHSCHHRHFGVGYVLGAQTAAGTFCLAFSLFIQASVCSSLDG